MVWWLHGDQERWGQRLGIHNSQGGHTSASPVTSHFAPTLSQFCPQVLLHARSHNALSALKESAGSMTLSQMPEVKGQSEQTAQAPQCAERNLGLKQRVLWFNHKTTLHMRAKCQLADLHAWELLITTECFHLTSRHGFYLNASQ